MGKVIWKSCGVGKTEYSFFVQLFQKVSPFKNLEWIEVSASKINLKRKYFIKIFILFLGTVTFDIIL